MKVYEEIVTRVNEMAFRALMRNPYVRLYLFFKPASKTGDADFMVVASEEEAPVDWKPVTPQPLPTNITKPQLRAWLWSRMRGLPILRP